MNFERELPEAARRLASQYGRPDHLRRAAALAEQLRQKRADELQDLYGVNEHIAALNYERYQNWSPEAHAPESSSAPSKDPEAEPRPALFAYDGPVYKGFDAWTIDTESLQRAQRQVFLLSGLYGSLKPLDLIQPYRLDMGAPLEAPGSRKIEEYWRESVTEDVRGALREDADRLPGDGESVLVNLASKEYAAAVDFDSLGVRVVTPVFRDYRNGRYKQIQSYVKHFRGAMARWIVEHQPPNIATLTRFSGGGYGYDAESSSSSELVFLRSA
jgi:hypothetical protein